jgi:hypothetical protein
MAGGEEGGGADCFFLHPTKATAAIMSRTAIRTKNFFTKQYLLLE